MKQFILSIFTMILITTSLLSCQTTVDKTYLRAHRSTFAAIIPEYREYVRNDPNLTEDQIELREATVRSWESLLWEAEQ